ncbi:hypothetical protein BC936DRAFT_144618 [Jimgerdemannia flammicorona]|uniref:Uncharacterized protein n=1 Tax=Jimgerdemannia flammicorona TaxID=994334 RepID=A0A433DC49_9FUNG|nr:hypothetical protein BC936DRAFT_144618 [Jimgerdemannia flammicorona]
MMINIKHLVNDVYHSTLSSIRPSVDISEPAGEEVIGTPTPTTSTEPSTSTSFTILKASQGAPRDQEKRADTSVVSTVVAALMSWGIDQAIDQTCERSLGLGRPAANLTFGVRG